MRVFTDRHTHRRKDGSDSMISTADAGGNRKELSLNQNNKGAAIEKPLFVVQGCLEMNVSRLFAGTVRTVHVEMSI